MATETETWVLNLLSATEVPQNAPEQIEAAGTDAVNVACEAALGTYVGMRPKIRSNAAWAVGRMTSRQANDTLLLLVNDASDDVAIRAIRAAGRLRVPELDARVALTLRRLEASPLVVSEAINALAGKPEGQDAIRQYRQLEGPNIPPHRRSPLVENAIQRAVVGRER